jgi:hypothetical protein
MSGQAPRYACGVLGTSGMSAHLHLVMYQRKGLAAVRSPNKNDQYDYTTLIKKEIFMIKSKMTVWYITLIIILLISGNCKNSTEPDKDPICFTVSQYTSKVTVNHIWNSNASQEVDLTGMSAGEVTIRRENESHTLVFTNITKNTGIIQSFTVVIDGNSYSYPKNKC